MNQLISFVFFSLFLCSFLHAQSVYKSDDIPESLTKDADAVIRLNKKVLTVEGIDQVKMEVEYAVTVLNRSGDPYGYVMVPYDEKLEKAKITDARVYSASGKLLDKMKKSDVESINQSGNDITSNRYLVASLKQSQYPYTVVYKYEKTIAGLLFFPYWSPQPFQNVSVQDAELTLNVPNNLKLSHYALNTDVKPEVKSIGNNSTQYFWRMVHLPTAEKEPLQPEWREVMPVVYLNTDKIKAGNVEGNMDSWENYGMMFYELNKDRDELPKELAEEVNRLTNGIDDPYEKIARLYKYVQDNTRYVSIQLGIGGWQTFEAKEVYENGYGDCKALSNYTKSLLKSAGINAYLTLVGAGTDLPPVQTSFANNPFNHMILCVPMEKDTVWLECTSSVNPAGYLGISTENRHVLLLTPEGGKLVRTPVSTSEKNQQTRVADVFLDRSGNATVKVRETSSGFQQSYIRSLAEQGSEKEKEDWMKEKIEAGSFSLGKFSLQPLSDSHIPTCEVNYEINATNWAAKSGSRIFLSPNVLEKRTSVPDKVDERTQSLDLHLPYLDRDTITYHLPEGYSIEAMPEADTKIETIFGAYQSNIKMESPTKLIYTRELRMEKIRLPASYYDQYRDFIREVVKADKMQVVLSDKS